MFPCHFFKGGNFCDLQFDFLDDVALPDWGLPFRERICFFLGMNSLTLLHSEGPKLYTILAFLSAIELIVDPVEKGGKKRRASFLENKHIHLT